MNRIGLVGLLMLVMARSGWGIMLEEVGRDEYGDLSVLLEWTIDLQSSRTPCRANWIHCEIRFYMLNKERMSWEEFRSREIIYGHIRTGRVRVSGLERGVEYRAVFIALGELYGKTFSAADTVEFSINTEPLEPEPPTEPESENTHSLPLVLPADTAGLEGFIRIINRAAQAGNISILAIDDTGRSFGPVSMAIDALEAIHINSRELERGSASKGLLSGVGNGEGSWRLELTTALDILHLAYIPTTDGFVTAMHDVAPVLDMEHSIPFFNPGSNNRQVSRLRIFNPGTTTAQVTISGRDDAGDDAPGGTIRLTLPARSARTLTAQSLEAGGDGFDGRLGDGAGKWRLSVSSNVAIQVMSLLASPTGHISNLSTVPID